MQAEAQGQGRAAARATTAAGRRVTMARMLGRYEMPGCCPGTRQGARPGPDCSGAERSTRRRKRAERRAWRRESAEANFADARIVSGISRKRS